MAEDDFLRALTLADRLRIAAVDLPVTGAPRALIEAVSVASEEVERRLDFSPHLDKASAAVLHRVSIEIFAFRVVTVSRTDRPQEGCGPRPA